MNLHLNTLIAITLLCWGACGICDKKALAGASPLAVFLATYACLALPAPFAFCALNAGASNWHLTGPLLLWTGLATLAYTIAAPACLVALKQTQASYVLGITAAYPLILQVLAALLLHEPLVGNRIAGASLIGMGIGAIGFSACHPGKELTGKQKVWLWSNIILATLCWGVWGFFDKMALQCGTPLEAFLAHRLWDTLTILAVGLTVYVRRYPVDVRSSSLWKYSGLSVVLLVIASWTFLNAMAIASASYVISITGCYPLIMYLLALWLLKEPFNRARLAGIALVVAGGILVQITQAA